MQSLNATHQQKTLQTMLQAAQKAEDNLHAIQRVAREAVGMSQAFHAGATGGIQTVAGAFPSQPETTLTRYFSNGKLQAASHPPRGGGLKRPWLCFGCGGPHPYSEFCGNEVHIIICPNKDNPGVRENAACNIEKNVQEPEKTPSSELQEEESRDCKSIQL
jgi:hypothetical protein